ncbi:MAG: hypothetical protein U0U66_11375 [Cytophagaceae bacterium]
MKNIIATALFILGFLNMNAFAQKKSYFVYESKTLFSMHNLELSNINHPTNEMISPNNVVRFAPYFNANLQYNYDFGNKFGLFLGAGLQNSGFITKDSMNNTIKQRAYGVNVPLGFKIGNMKKDIYFFGQGDFFWNFDYKEKYFNGKSKSKSKPGDAINSINYGATAGFCIKSFTIGFQYIFTDFFKDSYKFDYNRTIDSDSYSVDKSNIYSFFVGFRTKLVKQEESVPTKVQQARASVY